MQNKKIVCIDSDGCAMDTMNYKHMYCFGPIAAKIFEVENSEIFLKTWNKVNLFSKTRGVNRFKALYLVFEKINKPLEEVKKWVESSSELSNDSLKKEIEKTKSKELEKTLIWSLEVNEKIESMKDLAKPFDNVKDCIDRIKKYVDLAVVSAANNEAIEDEWTKFGLINSINYVMGQNQGTKKECIKFLIDMGYEPCNILMIGDSPGDIKAAKDNNTLVYPIIVNSEVESWEYFTKVILNKFVNNEYDDSEYIKTYEEKLGELCQE